MLIRSSIFTISLILAAAAALADAPQDSTEGYCQWEIIDYGIEKSLCGLSGDAERGERIVTDSYKGNCLACHQLPIEGVEAYGTIGPPLQGLAARMSEAQIRLRVVDSRSINPMSIMPGFYRDPDLINRPAKAYLGKTFLSAQQVEDVIAYLATLK
jgi:sulfur-oxidizing protein SoxX